ncbi:hypothetical protein KA005_28265 [bacterium]|nr:hypothetical protein [bacterium]
MEKEIGSFLQTYNWDYFFTVTPRYPRKDPIAFMRDIWNEIKPTPQFDRFGFNTHVTRAFMACEPFFLGRNLHVHGLIAGDHDIYLPWRLVGPLDSYLGRSRMELCGSQKQVSNYCSKYVSKYLGGDNYDFFGEWSPGSR